MSGPDAGAFALNNPDLKPVLLPFEGLTILQNRRYQPVTHASVFLQQEVIRHYPQAFLRVLELGSGCGIVSIMLALQRPGWQITGLEIQTEEVELARANALRCSVDADFRQGDLKIWESSGDFDLIIGNPPWQPLNTGKSSPLITRRTGREELACNMDDVLSAVHRLSGEGTEAMLVYPLSRLQDFRDKLEKSSLDTIQVLFSSDSKRYFIGQTRKRGT